MSGRSGKIGRKRERVLTALLSTSTIAQAAEQSGVSISSVNRCLADEAFRAALRAAESAIMAGVTRKLIVNSGSMSDVLLEIAIDPDAPKPSRVAAVIGGIKLAQGGHEIGNLESRIAMLEAQSRGKKSE